MKFKLKSSHLAGFDIIGYRQPDGTIVIGDGREQVKLPEFPDEVELLGNVYTLEGIEKNKDLYNLPSSHEGYSIEWGIYV